MVHGYLGGGERLAEQVERVDDPVNKPVMDNNTWMWMDEYKDDCGDAMRTRNGATAYGTWALSAHPPRGGVWHVQLGCHGCWRRWRDSDGPIYIYFPRRGTGFGSKWS